MIKGNGHLHCPLTNELYYDKEEIDGALKRINETHELMGTLISYAKHLESLDQLPKMTEMHRQLQEVLCDIKEALLPAVIGKDQIPVNVHNILFAQLSKINKFNHLVYGGIITTLLSVIGILLVGEKFQWFNLFHN